LNWLRSQRLAKLGADLEGHDRPLRSGERDAAKRVPEGASETTGAADNDRETAETDRSPDCDCPESERPSCP